MLASLESGRWVSEERYEMGSFSPAVRNIRREKEATTGEFRSELFRGESVNSTVSKHKSLLASFKPFKKEFDICLFFLNPAIFIPLSPYSPPDPPALMKM